MLLELMLTAGEPPGKKKTEVLQQAWVHQYVVSFKYQQLKNPVFYEQSFLKKTLALKRTYMNLLKALKMPIIQRVVWSILSHLWFFYPFRGEHMSQN